VDVNFVKTLHKNEIIAGLSEAVKITFADRGDSFDQYLDYQIVCSNDLSLDNLSELVALTLKVKKKFIEEDEFDMGVRQLLNFGHGIGHAIEASSSYAITHGVAVGVGMIAEMKMAQILSANKCQSIRQEKLINYLKKFLFKWMA